LFTSIVKNLWHTAEGAAGTAGRPRPGRRARRQKFTRIPAITASWRLELLFASTGICA